MNVGNVNTYKNQFIWNQKEKLYIIAGAKLERWKAKKNVINLNQLKDSIYLEQEKNKMATVDCEAITKKTKEYIVTILDEDGFEFLMYKGDDYNKAQSTYKSYKEEKNNFKITFYEKYIIDEIDKR